MRMAKSFIMVDDDDQVEDASTILDTKTFGSNITNMWHAFTTYVAFLGNLNFLLPSSVILPSYTFLMMGYLWKLWDYPLTIVT